MKNKSKKKRKAQDRINAVELVVNDLTEPSGLCSRCKKRDAEVSLLISPVYENAVHTARPDLINKTKLCLECHDQVIPELIKEINASPRRIPGHYDK